MAETKVPVSEATSNVTSSGRGNRLPRSSSRRTRPIDPNLVLEAGGASFVAASIGHPIDDRPITEVLEELLNYVQFQVVARLEPLVR